MKKRVTTIGIFALAIVSVLLTVVTLTIFSKYLKEDEAGRTAEKELSKAKEQVTILKEERDKLKNPDKSKLCDCTRTFQVVSFLEFAGAIPDETFVVLTSFSSSAPFILKINQAQKRQLEVGKSYEFDLIMNVSLYHDSPSEALRTAQITNIMYTPKQGLNQLQTSCK